MSGQGPVSAWTDCSSSAEPQAMTRTEGGGSGPEGSLRNLLEKLQAPGILHIHGSVGHYQNSKGTDGVKDGQKMNSNIANLQELWETPQIQTVHIPKAMTDMSFLKHPDFTIGQKHYLCSTAKICNVNYLRALMKRQYMHMIRRNSQKPGVLTHHRSRLSSHHSQKHHYPCTTWRHQLESEDLGPSNIAAAYAPEMIIQHSPWRPVRNKGGLKTGYVSKTRCKSLKIFRKPDRLFIPSVSRNDFESNMIEEKKEDLLSECMQSMSIEEQGEQLMLT